MAMKGLLKGLTGRSADAEHPGAPAATTTAAKKPLSPEFATVTKPSARMPSATRAPMSIWAGWP